MRGSVITGHSAYGSLEQSLAALRAYENEAAGRLDGATRRLAELRADETEAYRDLARFRLEAAGAALGGELDRTALRARAVLAMRDADRARTEEEVRRTAATIAEVVERHDAAAKALDEAEDRRDALMTTVTDRLKTDAAFTAAEQQAAETASLAFQADEKAKEAEKDREEKRVPYESDPLFMYLLKRGFGTADYPATGLVRFLDRLIARFIGFEAARPNYLMLNEIPRRLREHADKLKADAEAARTDAPKVIREAYLKEGGERIDTEIMRLHNELKRLDDLRETRENEHEQALARRAEFAEGRDPRSREAIDTLVSALRAEGVARLYQAARATPSPADEAIVARIDAAERSIREIEGALGQTRSQLEQARSRSGELGRVARDFRARGWDRDGSNFDGNVMGDLLEGFLKGMISAGDAWSRMERGRRLPQRPPGPMFPPTGGPWGQAGGAWDDGRRWGGPFGGGWAGGAGGGFGGGGSWGGGGGGGGGSGGGGGGRRGSDGFTTEGGF